MQKYTGKYFIGRAKKKHQMVIVDGTVAASDNRKVLADINA